MIIGTGMERRASRRRTGAECAWLIAARLRPGRDVRVLDLSTGGALIEATVRLLPGAPFVLHLVDAGGLHTVRGKVLRCHVSALDRSTGVRYRAALGFDHCFAIPGESEQAGLQDMPAAIECCLAGSCFPSSKARNSV